VKKLLCVISQPPYRNSHSLELLETAMVAAVFDLQVSILFRDAGVLALIDEQEGQPIGVRTLSKVLTALPTYEIQSLYVCGPSIVRYKIEKLNSIPAATIDHAEQAALISAQDVVIGAQS
jgi:tRNA 2-thiouridine synthesizing protein C